MWFELLMGFREDSPEQVRTNIIAGDGTLTSRVNGNTFVCGSLETPTLGELRTRVEGLSLQGRLALQEVVADVKSLHAERAHQGALFQVASQFNLLEMTSPSITPEYGVGIYENDWTQGPACAIAAGAGTIYRNYFAEVNGQVGQSANNQIDCLSDLGHAFGNKDGRLWTMRNGYALASRAGLLEISERITASTQRERDALRQRLRIGIQWNTQVTWKGCSHLVTQAYCSALPVAYSTQAESLWAPFAQLVLEASYEATLCTALLNVSQNGQNKVFLTLLGGGAFGNEDDWIFSAIQRALELFLNHPLDIAIVSYGSSNARIRELVSAF